MIICCNWSLLKRIQISTHLMGSCKCEGNVDRRIIILFHVEFGPEYHRGSCCRKVYGHSLQGRRSLKTHKVAFKNSTTSQFFPQTPHWWFSIGPACVLHPPPLFLQHLPHKNFTNLTLFCH